MVGPDKDASMGLFRNYIRSKDIEDHVKITGKLSKEEWIALSKNYDFFINTANIDNTPVSVIEAMALGLCVVSTNPGGIPYMLQDNVNAVLCKPGEPQVMVEKITKLLNNCLIYSEIAAEGRKAALKYSWESVKGQWIDLLK